MDGLTGQASLVSVTEYLLTQPILSFIVSGHAPCRTTNEAGGGGESGEEGEGGRGELAERGDLDSRLVTVLIELFCIHTRLQFYDTWEWHCKARREVSREG